MSLIKYKLKNTEKNIFSHKDFIEKTVEIKDESAAKVKNFMIFLNIIF